VAIRPAFQFYPADWRNNAKLRRCSEAARGAWVDVLCILHDSDEYGVLRWPLADIAQAAGVRLAHLKELSQKDVFKGADKGAGDFIYTPRHGGKDGDPVILVAVGNGPCWYCSRFVKDEYVRQRRGASTRFDADNQPPKAAPNPQPKGGIGGRQGDGASSSSSSSKSKSKNPPAASVDPKADLFARWKSVPGSGGGAFLVKLLKDHKPEQRVLEAIETTLAETRADPKAYVLGVLARGGDPTDKWITDPDSAPWAGALR
jgi:hypothetical protein